METKNKIHTLAIKVLVGVLVVSFIVSFGIIWAEHETNIRIQPLVETGTVVEADTEIEVFRTSEMNADVSTASMISGTIQGMSQKLDAAKTFQEFVGACNSIVHKNETITIPKGAGVVEFEGIRVYTWDRTAEKWFGNLKTSKTSVAMFYDNRYVAAFSSGDLTDSKVLNFLMLLIGLLKVEVSVETGTYQ